MCGRFFLDADFEDVLRHYFGETGAAIDLSCKSGDFYPSDSVPVIHRGMETERSIHLMKWGFQPEYMSKRIINARSETISQKPMFREAFIRRRCFIPASGYYEWHDKVKHAIRVPDREIISFAGIYDRFTDKDNNLIWAVSILTKASNESVRQIHDRMPVVLNEKDEKRWIANCQGDYKPLLEIVESSSPKFIFEAIEKDIKQDEQLTLIYE